MATPFTAPNTPFNGAISAHRKVAFANVSLDELKMVKNAFGTTLNDVVLALCAGALRRYLTPTASIPTSPSSPRAGVGPG